MRARNVWVGGAVVVAALAGGGGGGCGSGNSGSGFDGGAGGDATAHPDGPLGDGNPMFGDGSAVTSLTISPANPTVDVTITDGNVMTMPLTFQALANGTAAVSASWSLDRGELGALDPASGVFTASGNLSGVGTVTAKYQSVMAATQVTVRLHVTQNGRPGGADAGVVDAGAGGIGGVGGEGLGGPVNMGTQGALQGGGTPPANAQELGWLYPYDKTVWPRGILAPLLQWQTTHAVSAVEIHLTENNYDFQGFYSGTSLVHQPIDQTAWTQATYGNGGDALHVALTIYDSGTVVGPITEDWTVAPGTLKGTVYYNSYNSSLPSMQTGAVLAIDPGATSPTIAVPSTGTSCHVCHTLAADGQTIFIENKDDGSDYANGASYDLKNGGAQIAYYMGTAADGTSNNEKFVWAGVYPDGTFAMANSRHAREHYNGDSQLFKTSDATAIATTGFSNIVTSAVTPAFSPDGTKLAFNFWEGPGNGTIQAGSGHLLTIMDFACGAADGGLTCGAPPYTLSNLRVLYQDPGRYPGWPAFLPDGSGVVFHNTVTPGTGGDDEIATWQGAQAEIWFTPVASPSAMRLDALDGFAGGQSYLPTNAMHPTDGILNYEPTVNPIPSGGYFWVVFTSRRMYGNIATGDPYDNGNGTYPIPKKLWVAAIDAMPKPGQDPSHPAFYLPGQELNAGNMRGFWAVEPCKANGQSCTTGDECCNGFCEQNPDGGGLVCTNQSSGCSQEFEHCNTNADCCGAAQGYQCINHFCSQPSK